MSAFVKSTSSMCSFCSSKPLTSSIICITVATAAYYCALISLGDPSDLQNMKHSFIKVIPEHHFSLDKPDHKVKVKDTLNCVVPPIVHYVWCQKDNFQFQNYLSVLSAYKLLKPTEIIFHYQYLPFRDSEGYYQYFEDLQRDLPNFFSEPLKDDRVCSQDSTEVREHLIEMLNPNGGVFLGIDVTLSNEALNYMDKPMSIFVPDFKEFSSAGVIFISGGGIDFSLEAASKIKCKSSRSFQVNDPCTVVKEELFPFQIFTLETQFGKLARSVAYGKEEMLQPGLQKSLIPNIVHYVWLGNRFFSFFAYLSLLGSLYIQKADTVYVHGNIEPYGKYWDEAIRSQKVKFIRREFPETVFGYEIRNPSHASDVLRFDILLRYGGIYLDWDFLWTNQLSDHQRRHESIACVDWPKAGKFPDTFNLGIFGAMKGASYVKFMLETFRHYVEIDWGFNAIRIPYKVYEHHPDSLYVDRHLQVICFSLKCHPVWLPGYLEDIDNAHEGPFDWKTETNGVHWTYPDPEEFTDLETLISAKGKFAEIGQNILRYAGKIE